MTISSIKIISFTLLPALVSTQTVCFLCGEDDVTFSNPSALIPIPPEFQDLVPPGFTLDCGTADTFGRQGIVPEDICAVLNENLAEVQEICGCSNFVAPTDSPTETAATDSPTASPTETAATDSPTAAATTASPTETPATDSPTAAATTASPTETTPSPITPETPSPVTPETPAPITPTTPAPVTPTTPAPSPPTGSSLICLDGKCTFTRIDTDGPALVPYKEITMSPFPVCDPAVDRGCAPPDDGRRNLDALFKKHVADLNKKENEVNSRRRDSSLTPPKPKTTFTNFKPRYKTRAGPVIPTEPPVPPTNPPVPPIPPTNAPSGSGTEFPTYGPPVDTTIAPWTDPENQDMLSESVAITRDWMGGIFNALYPDYMGSPIGTEWALLPEDMTFEEARCKLNFGPWESNFANYDPASMVGKPGVVHVLEEDLYFNIMFTNWTADNFDYSPYDEPVLGGGFQYIRDEVGFMIDESLPECPVCDDASATPSYITGELDDSFVSVEVEGVTPVTATVNILTVRQDSDPKCNSVRNSAERVGINARNINGTTVDLRRTKALGQLSPFWYTIYFKAETEAGYCIGETRVCVPRPGFDCDYPVYTYDAFTTDVCLD